MEVRPRMPPALTRPSSQITGRSLSARGVVRGIQQHTALSANQPRLQQPMARVRHAHTVKLPSNGPSHGAKRTPIIRQMRKPPSHITHITPLPVPRKLPSLFYHNQGMRLPASDSSTAVSAVGNTYHSLPLHTCSFALYSASQLHYSPPPPALPALVPVERLRATVYLTKASACLFTINDALNACESCGRQSGQQESRPPSRQVIC
jgi:hypothetical protein